MAAQGTAGARRPSVVNRHKPLPLACLWTSGKTVEARQGAPPSLLKDLPNQACQSVGRTAPRTAQESLSPQYWPYWRSSIGGSTSDRDGGWSSTAAGCGGGATAGAACGIGLVDILAAATEPMPSR